MLQDNASTRHFKKKRNPDNFQLPHRFLRATVSAWDLPLLASANTSPAEKNNLQRNQQQTPKTVFTAQA